MNVVRFRRLGQAAVTLGGLLSIASTMASSCDSNQHPPFFPASVGIVCKAQAQLCTQGTRGNDCIGFQPTAGEYNPPILTDCVPDTHTGAALDADCQQRVCGQCKLPDCENCVAVFDRSAPGGCQLPVNSPLIGGGVSSGGGGSGGSGGTGFPPSGSPYHVVSIEFTAAQLTGGVTTDPSVTEFSFATDLGMPTGVDVSENVYVSTAANGSNATGEVFGVDVGTNTFAPGPVQPPAPFTNPVTIKAGEQISLTPPHAHVVVGSNAGVALLDLQQGSAPALSSAQIPNVNDLSLTPLFNMAAEDAAAITANPFAAVALTSLEATHPVVKSTSLGSTLQPVSVSSGEDSFWVAAQDTLTKHGALLKFATQSATQLGVTGDLGPVGVVKIDGAASAEDTTSTPSAIVVAVVPGPGEGALLLFPGGNTATSNPGKIVLDGEPRALSVFQLTVGGGTSAPIEFAWVAVQTQAGTRVECYNLANGIETTFVDIGPTEAVDMATALRPFTQAQSSSAFVHVLVQD